MSQLSTRLGSPFTLLVPPSPPPPRWPVVSWASPEITVQLSSLSTTACCKSQARWRSRQEVSDTLSCRLLPLLIVQDSGNLSRKAFRSLLRAVGLWLTHWRRKDRPGNASVRFILLAISHLYFDSCSWDCRCSVLEETCQRQSR